MKPQRIDARALPVALCLLASLGLWLLGTLAEDLSGQVASLYELQATLKRDAVVSVFAGK
ncbi:hypothetical protein [Sinorhizobium saheli]|uniref:hypothetical protein n=1 Tax=Sinorhizobium saheli TaxID=36856 RepID=UPI00129677F0|nr:hypothetical protein [Sinorhizobium saheli]